MSEPILFKSKNEVAKVLLEDLPTGKYYNIYKIEVFKEDDLPTKSDKYKASVSLFLVRDVGVCHFDYSDAIIKNGTPKHVRISLNKRKIIEEFSINMFKACICCNEYTQYYGFIDFEKYKSIEELEKLLNETLSKPF